MIEQPCANEKNKTTEKNTTTIASVSPPPTMNALANETLEEGELEQSICSVIEKSWYEECEQADREMTVSLNGRKNVIFF